MYPQIVPSSLSSIACDALLKKYISFLKKISIFNFILFRYDDERKIYLENAAKQVLISSLPKDLVNLKIFLSKLKSWLFQNMLTKDVRSCEANGASFVAVIFFENFCKK